MFIIGEARGCVRGQVQLTCYLASGKKKKRGDRGERVSGEGGEERQEREKEIGERKGERQPDGQRERGREGGVCGWEVWWDGVAGSAAFSLAGPGVELVRRVRFLSLAALWDRKVWRAEPPWRSVSFWAQTMGSCLSPPVSSGSLGTQNG